MPAPRTSIGNGLGAFAPVLCVMMALCVSAGCRAPAPLHPIDLHQPGWNVREGQAMWRQKSDAPEVAGELLVAFHPDGGGFAQFTKTPLPLVIAQIDAAGWQVEFTGGNRRYSGRGLPPSRIVWFQLLQAVRGMSVAKDWTFTSGSDGSWRLRRKATGEVLEGYTVARPSKP